MGAILSVLYALLFLLLRLEDYALLAGSIGLFVILAIVMFITRRVNWQDAKS
jgi:inner membrane protein